MKFETFSVEAEKTQAKSENFRLNDSKLQEALYGATRLAIESAEVLEQIEKTVFRNNGPLDRISIMDELGDVAYGISIVMRALDLNWGETLENQIAKNQYLYGEKGYRWIPASQRKKSEEKKAIFDPKYEEYGI